MRVDGSLANWCRMNDWSHRSAILPLPFIVDEWYLFVITFRSVVQSSTTMKVGGTHKWCVQGGGGAAGAGSGGGAPGGGSGGGAPGGGSGGGNVSVPQCFVLPTPTPLVSCPPCCALCVCSHKSLDKVYKKKIHSSGIINSMWREANIITIRKPGKPQDDPSYYTHQYHCFAFHTSF